MNTEFSTETMAALAKLEVPEDHSIADDAMLRQALDSISFRNSVIDFKWRFNFRPLTLPAALDQNTNQTTEGREGWLLWTEFWRPDINPPYAFGYGRGRDEIILKGQKVSGVVKTAWVLVKMLVEHELMEGFRYDGIQIFNPHHTVGQLMVGGILFQKEHKK
jgi:hypothetical protein